MSKTRVVARTTLCRRLLLSSYTRVISTDSFNVTLVHEDSNYNPVHKVVLATTSVLLIHPCSDKGYDLFQRLVKGFINRSLREGVNLLTSTLVC